jgi:hypothetical protein
MDRGAQLGLMLLLALYLLHHLLAAAYIICAAAQGVPSTERRSFSFAGVETRPVWR